MPSGLIPLFPLHVVVFPRTRLPLHIFEDRYKEMVGNAIRDRSEFGIVLAQEEGVVNTGCTVQVENVLQMYPDGRMDIVTRGLRRFEIVGIDEEKAFLQAEVNFFDDDDFAAVPAELREAGARALPRVGEPALRRHRAGSERSAAQLPIGSGFAGSGFSEHAFAAPLRIRAVRQLNRYLADYLPRERDIQRVRGLAPTNGFGGKPAGL